MNDCLYSSGYGYYCYSGSSYLIYDNQYTHINKDKYLRCLHLTYKHLSINKDKKHSTIYIQDGLLAFYIRKYRYKKTPERITLYDRYTGGWGGALRKIKLYI
jgi:hypothetical protein